MRRSALPLFHAASAPVPFQSDGHFAFRADPAVLAGEPFLGSGFGRGVAGRFNADDVVDAAVVVASPRPGGSAVQVVVNPIAWGLAIELR